MATKPTPQESWSKRGSKRLGVTQRSLDFEAKNPIRNYNPRFRDKQPVMKNFFCTKDGKCRHMTFWLKKRHPFVDKWTLYIYTC